MTDVVFKLSSRELNSEVNLKPEAWRMLAQVNGARTVTEIAQNLGIDAALAARSVEQLRQAGLLEPATGNLAAPQLTVDAQFFDWVAREFARVIGPMASIIIEDEIAALGETREQFPRDRIAELVEDISAEVRDDAKRLRFQQIMLDAIRKL
ncbi:MAG: MarR family transcriptional regulator [Chloroflexi bacterium]|nr:MarR family transcriptional regulator [Chloroflexota bacterium]